MFFVIVDMNGNSLLFWFCKIMLTAQNAHDSLSSYQGTIALLKCPYHQNCYFLIWSYVSRNEHGWKYFSIWMKSDFLRIFKNLKSYFLAVYPCRWSHDHHAQICDVDSGMWDFSLHLSWLFYLCKFSFIVHAKCSFAAFYMNYEVKFTEVKQAR